MKLVKAKDARHGCSRFFVRRFRNQLDFRVVLLFLAPKSTRVEVLGRRERREAASGSDVWHDAARVQREPESVFASTLQVVRDEQVEMAADCVQSIRNSCSTRLCSCPCVRS